MWFDSIVMGTDARLRIIRLQKNSKNVRSWSEERTRSPATAGTANRSLLFLEHRIPMPELFTELRFTVLREFWTQEIRLPLLGGDAPRLG